jgi:excisionase family DNA binding protein
VPDASVDEAAALGAVLDGDKRAWREFVRRYEGPLREVVRHATEAIGAFDDEIDDVLGDFWLRLVEEDFRMLRAFNPSRGSALLTWLTFHVAQVAHDQFRERHAAQTVPLKRARHVPDPRPLPEPQFRSERASIDSAIRETVRQAVRDEVRIAVRDELARVETKALTNTNDCYLSVSEAAKLLQVHTATIRAWIRTGQLPQHRAGRHYRVRRSDLHALAGAPPPSEKLDLDERAAELARA